MSGPAGQVAVVFRGDAGPGQAPAPSPRLAPVFSALAGLGLAAEPVPYCGIRAELVRDRLLAMDAVLAWVDPVTAASLTRSCGRSPRRGSGSARIRTSSPRWGLRRCCTPPGSSAGAPIPT